MLPSLLIVLQIRCLFSRSFKICRNNNLLLKEKIQLINNFHFKLDYPLHVLYEVYRVCVSNVLTDKLICYGPHKPKLFVSLPIIGQLSCSEVKHLIRSVVLNK